MLSATLRRLRLRSCVAAGAATGLGLAAYRFANVDAVSLCDAAAAPSPPTAEDPAQSMRAAWESMTAPVRTFVSKNLIEPFTEPSREKLLPDLPARYQGKEPPTLVIHLDDVLLHSTWDRQYGWRYMKRPGVDEFLKALAPYYEIVVWSEQFNIMEPVIFSLDRHQAVRHRLYKDGMIYRNGRHLKDLRHVNRNLAKTVVVDCKPEHAVQQPENYVFVPPFEGQPGEEANLANSPLVRHIPFLLNLARLALVQGVDVRCARAPAHARRARARPRPGSSPACIRSAFL